MSRPPTIDVDDPFARDPLFLSLRQAARRLGVGVYSLQRVRERGEFDTYEIGGAARVRTDHLRAWLERHRHPALVARQEREP